MMTFRMYLEAIAQHVGPYTGDPVQARAVSDIADEEDSSFEEIDTYFIQPIRSLIQDMSGQIARSFENPIPNDVRRFWERLFDIEVALERDAATRGHFYAYMMVDTIKKFTSLMPTWRNLLKTYPHLESISADMNQLINLFKGLSRQGVKDTFAKRGSDTTIARILVQFENAINRWFQVNDPQWEEYAQVIDELNLRSEEAVLKNFLRNPREESIFLVMAVVSNVSANISNNYDENQSLSRLFDRIMASKEFYELADGRIRRLITLFRRQKQRAERGHI